MKTIGILGGMSWESSQEYYRLINQMVHDKLGGHHSAKIAMVSVDFAPIEELLRTKHQEKLAQELIKAAQQVEKAGADLLVIATNTMHQFFDQIQASLSIPIVHIADAAGEKIKRSSLTCVGLLGTIFTMEKDFYRTRLANKYDLDVIIPERKDREIVNSIIFDELVHGIIKEQSKQIFKKIIEHLVEKGAQGVILGCTEIPMLITGEDFDFPLFDTTLLHAEAAVKQAFAD